MKQCTLRYGFSGSCTFSLTGGIDCDDNHQLDFTITNDDETYWTVVQSTENEILVHSGPNSDGVVHHCFIDGSYELHINSENEGSVDVTHTQSGSSILTCTVEENSCYKTCEFNVGSAEVDPIECDENNEAMISISVHNQEGCGEWQEEISWTISLRTSFTVRTLSVITESLNQQHTETGSDEYTTVVDGFAPYVVFERELFECVSSYARFENTRLMFSPTLIFHRAPQHRYENTLCMSEEGNHEIEMVDSWVRISLTHFFFFFSLTSSSSSYTKFTPLREMDGMTTESYYEELKRMK